MLTTITPDILKLLVYYIIKINELNQYKNNVNKLKNYLLRFEFIELDFEK